MAEEKKHYMTEDFLEEQPEVSTIIEEMLNRTSQCYYRQ